MSIFEYNEELHIQMERKDAREEGYAEGKEDGILTMVRAILKANEPLETPDCPRRKSNGCNPNSAVSPLAVFTAIL